MRHRENVMKSDNTSKSKKKKNWEYGRKSQSCQQKKKELTHTYFELTSVPQSSKSRQMCNWTEKSSLRRQQIKCREEKHVNLFCPKVFEWLCVFCGIGPLTPSCWHRRHPSEMTNVTWQTCLGNCGDYTQTAAYSTVCDRGKVVKQEAHIQIYWSPKGL